MGGEKVVSTSGKSRLCLYPKALAACSTEVCFNTNICLMP